MQQVKRNGAWEPEENERKKRSPRLPAYDRGTRRFDWRNHVSQQDEEEGEA